MPIIQSLYSQPFYGFKTQSVTVSEEFNSLLLLPFEAEALLNNT
jgi:hypothetical protein